MKYIMFEWPALDGQTFTHVPVIFPEMLNHSTMAEMVNHAWHEQLREARRGRGNFDDERRMRLGIEPRPVSAGFLDINATVDMGRPSESLKLRPHEADQIRINTWRYTYGQF